MRNAWGMPVGAWPLSRARSPSKHVPSCLPCLAASALPALWPPQLGKRGSGLASPKGHLLREPQQTNSTIVYCFPRALSKMGRAGGRISCGLCSRAGCPGAAQELLCLSVLSSSPRSRESPRPSWGSSPPVVSGQECFRGRPVPAVFSGCDCQPGSLRCLGVKSGSVGLGEDQL